MNVNALPLGIPVEWKKGTGAVTSNAHLGVGFVKIQFPKAKEWEPPDPSRMFPLDLHGSKLESLGCIGESVVSEGGSPILTWFGMVRAPYGEEMRWWRHEYPLLLEVGKAPGGSGGFEYFARTPRGNPGYPAAILFNQEGRLVKTVYWNPYCVVRFVLLNPRRDAFGWGSNYPAVALWFLS